MRNTSILILLVCVALPVAAAAPAQDDTRAQELFKEIRCVVCQAESIAESPALLAEDMRAFVRAGIKDGKSDAAILKSLEDRYGDKVLMRPPVRADTWLLWLAPLIFLILGLKFWLRRN